MRLEPIPTQAGADDRRSLAYGRSVLSRRMSMPDRRDERGYVAALVALLLLTLIGVSAFAVDAGHWYLVGQQAQRAADAAALAGVSQLPGDRPAAYARAYEFSAGNGFKNGVADTSVTPSLDGAPTRLRVTVSRQVDNIFGPLLGVDSTTITKTAVADYAGPVPMGSPCNEFGDDPDGSPGTGFGVHDRGELLGQRQALGPTSRTVTDSARPSTLLWVSGTHRLLRRDEQRESTPNGYIYIVT